MPRMTTAQRTAIATPATGLQVYDTTTNSYWHYNGTVWVASATADQKWIDGVTAGNIELVNPTGKEYVKYTDRGLKVTDKSFVLTDSYNASTNTMTQIPYDVNLFHNSYLFSTGNFTKSTPSQTTLFGTAHEVMIEGNDTRVNEGTIGFMANASILSTNTNNHNSIRAATFGTGHSGGGTVNQQIGASFSNYLSKNSKSDNLYGGYAINSVSTSQSVETITGFFNINQIRKYQTGVISNLIGVHTIPLLEANSSTNIANLYGFNHQPNFSATYSGNIFNYYDFYASNNGTFAGTITNKFGIYILGADKKNYLEGNLGLGVTSPIEKLEVQGSIKMVDGNQGIGKILSSDANGKASWVNPSTLSGLDVTNDSFSNNSSQTRVELATKSDGLTTRAAGEKFAIKDDGKVGIGNDAPTHMLTISATGNGVKILGLNTERPWEFIQTGTGGASSLDLKSTTDDKSFRITTNLGVINADFHVNDSVSSLNRVTLVPTSGGVIIGSTAIPVEKLEVNGAIKIGTTTTATPTAGTIRFNTTTNKFEGYDGTAWVAFH